MYGLQTKVIILATLLIFLFPLQGFAQEGTSTLEATTPNLIWRWVPIQDHHKAVLELRCGESAGKGTLIDSCNSEGVILTAYSLIKSGKDIKATFWNGQKAKGCQLLCHDGEIALLKTWIPKDINTAKLATSTTQDEKRLQILGPKGSDRLSTCTRVFEPANTSKIILDPFEMALVQSNGIGSPIFKGKEIVGVVLDLKQGTDNDISSMGKALQTFTSRKKQ